MIDDDRSSALQAAHWRWPLTGIGAILMLVLALGLGLGAMDAAARRERAAAAAIEAAGGIVRWDDDEAGASSPSSLGSSARRWAERISVGTYFRTVVAVRYPMPTDPDWRPAPDAKPGHRAHLLAGLRGVRVLEYRDGATDAELASLPDLLSLEDLGLESTRGEHLTDAGLAHLAGLTGLRRLWVGNSRITDAGLAALGKMTRLEFLCIQGGLETGAGLAHLAGATRLRNLRLFACGITDAGIDAIVRYDDLESLTLQACHATAPALGRLAGLTRLKSLSVNARLLTDDEKQRLRDSLRFVPRLSVH